MTHQEADKLLTDLFRVYEVIYELTEDYPESQSIDRAADHIADVIDDVKTFLHGTQLGG